MEMDWAPPRKVSVRLLRNQHRALSLRAQPSHRAILIAGVRWTARANGRIRERGGKENLALSRGIASFPLHEASSMKKSRF